MVARVKSSERSTSSARREVLVIEASEMEVTEEEIATMSPDTLKAKLTEYREKERKREENEQREELRRLVAGTSAENNRTGVHPEMRMMMDQRIQKPPNLEECSSYDMFRKKLQLWELNMKIPDAQKGSLIIQSLTNTSRFKKNLSEKFMTKYTIQEMSGEGSLEKVKEFLDAELKEKDLEKAVRKWRELRSCKRRRGEDIGDYMDRFEGSYLELKSAMPTTEIPQELRAVIMYDGAGVEGLEETVLLGKVDMGTKDTLLAQMEKAMKDVLGPGPCGRKKEETIDGVVRVEAVRRSENESCLWVGEKKYKQVKLKKMKNKKGEDGQPMKCFTCKSEYHFSSDCPKTKEEEGKEGKKRKKKSKFKRRDSSTSSSGAEDESLLMVQEQEYILAAGSISSFTWEARGAAALDSCCTASVSGQVWMDMFLEELEEEDREKVEGPFKSKKSFGFGNNGELKSQKYYIIPVEIARKRTRMKVEIIQSDIPLLMSRKSMEKAGIVLDFKEKKITVFGTTLPMLQTRSGHPVLRVQPNLNKSFEEALLVTNFKTGTRAEQRKGMIKLHRQFGHMPVERFVGFLKSTGVEWHPEMEQDLREIMEGCVGCLQRKRNPDLPAVAMPMATRFNEKVAVDLKVWGEEKYIL